MVFLIYPTIELVSSTAAVAWRVLGWAALVGFAGLYVVGFVLGMRGEWRRPTPAVRLIFGATILCALLTVPAIGLQATSFAPFIMAYASYGMVSNVWHWTVNAAGVVLVGSVTLATGAGFPLLAIVVLLAVVNTVNTWLIDRSIAADALQMELATSEEREAVARDVHDLLGHSLTVVKLKAELAARLVEHDPDRARAELEEIVRLTGDAVAGVRGTVTGLRSEGLTAQLGASRAALESAGVAVEVTGDTAAISPAQSLSAGWILRETTTNILRHAGATSVRIAIEPGTVVVEDDGIGIRAGPGNGLRGMAERATAAGAKLRVEPATAGGTRVSLTW